ncbi:MAG: 3-oxoacyl-ACP reductase family protein [Ruminococcus sp.]|nr:3-oxoacyl-ACP reductase family protein [Ruminococcus sp.]
MNTALITGGSRGIGRATALEFAKNGYAVAINYVKSEKSAKELALNIMREFSVPACAYRADVKNRNEVEEMTEKIQSDLGTITVLVNNAGISTQRDFRSIDENHWKTMLSTHLDGAFNCTQCVIPRMIKRQYGKIINIGSMWGIVGGSCEVHYSTAKAGLIGFTKALAKELAPSGITVNCVCPGVIETDMTKIFDEETLKDLKDKTLLKRLGTPKDIAKSASFLASKEADYITGQILNVSGGFIV